MALLLSSTETLTKDGSYPRGGGETSTSGGRGGLGPHIKFGGKIWGKAQPNSPNKRKNFGSSVTIRHKNWGKIPILGSYLTLRGQNLGLQQEFQRQTLGASPPISKHKSNSLGGVIYDSAGPK